MKFFTITLSILLLNLVSLAGQNILTGRIADSEGQPLAFANVVITHSVVNGQEIALKTQIGSVSDLDGNYVITNVPNGTVKISFIYIGYVHESFQVTYGDSETEQTLDVVLKSESIGLEEVVVTALAKGQMAAINQQVNALTVKNVVSADRIQQNPDANAAEALGRLPGVTVTRSGGEANGIVVRGMQGYSNVTINGVEVPVNLTSISQYALQNVEVFKSISADMDAGTPAGSVNLKLGVAPDKNKTSILAQAGYNDLNKHFKNYKFNIASSRRFFDKKLGFSLNLSTESTDRSTEQLQANIANNHETPVPGQPYLLKTYHIDLRDVDRVVKRNSAILTTDYRFSPSASIEWSNMFTHSPGGPLNVNHRYQSTGVSDYRIEDYRGNNAYNYTSILTAKHLLGRIKVDYSASVGYAQSNSDLWGTTIRDPKAFESPLTLGEMESLSHSEYIGRAQIENTSDDIREYELQNFQPSMLRRTSEANDLHLDMRINMNLPYTMGSSISGNLKWGGRYKHRDYDRQTFGVNKGDPYFGLVIKNDKLIPKEDGSFWNDDISIPAEHLDQDNIILGSYLLDQSNYNDNFLGEGYNFAWYPNMGEIGEMLSWWHNLTENYFNQGQDVWSAYWGQIGHLRNEEFNNNARGTSDHTINHFAGYLMTEMKIGKNLHFVPGLRYEQSHYDMNAWDVHQEPVSNYQLIGEEMNAIHDNYYLLPMVQLKYKPLAWLQGLLSYTQTLKRPSVVSGNPTVGGQLEPWIYQDKIANTYSSGNPNLKPERWTSYDIGLAAHGNKIGLFSLTLFYKEVEDKIANTRWTKMSIDSLPIVGSFQPNQRVDVTEIGNHPYTGIAKGFEVEWQTNFWYLPKPLSYFSLNLNYSYINNETTYVYKSSRDSIYGVDVRGRVLKERIVYDSIVKGPMTNQPTHLFNASLGFSFKGFETYLSYQYIGDVFLEKTTTMVMDRSKIAFHRLDLQAKYKLPLNGLELLLNIANITDTQETTKRRGDARLTSIERYGWTADIGLRFIF